MEPLSYGRSSLHRNAGTMTATEQPATLAASLVAALGQLSDVARTATADAGTYRYKYAELADVLAMARPILAANGLALLTHVADSQPGTVTVWAQFLHSTGDTLDAGQLTMQRGTTAQALGSAVTYARRYLTMAALCVAGDDDDGHSASEGPLRATQDEPPPSPERIRAIDLFERIKALDPSQREQFELWRGSNPGPLTVPALTRDSERAAMVAGTLTAIEAG